MIIKWINFSLSIAEQSQIKYEYLFFKRRTLLGKYFLCFTLHNPDKVNFTTQYEFRVKGADYGIHDGTVSIFAMQLKDKNIQELSIGIFEHFNNSVNDVKEKISPTIRFAM